jgi:hypothetical protein
MEKLGNRHERFGVRRGRTANLKDSADFPRTQSRHPVCRQQATVQQENDNEIRKYHLAQK